MVGNRNPAISLCRVCSMLMIVLCHIISYYTFIPGHQELPDILNAGVYTFLGISGYLYGSRTRTDWAGWMKQRAVKIILPAVILSAVVLTGGYLLGERRDAASVIFNLMQLQGLAFLLLDMGKYVSGHPLLGPLWFLTVIMLCYCLVPLLQKTRQAVRAANPYLLMTAAVFVCFGLCMTVQVCLFYFLTFSLGYYLAACAWKLHVKRFSVLTVCMIFLQLLRLVLRMRADGTPLYQTYTYLSHMALGLWILCLFLWLADIFPTAASRLAGTGVLSSFDKLSLYVYMTHGIFCRGPISPYTFMEGLLPATALFCVFTVASALLLRKVSESVSAMFS